MADKLTYGPGWPGWREQHGYAAGLAPGGPLGLIVTCPQGQTRAELQAPWDAMDGDDHWYGFTVQLPDGFSGGAADWCVLAQGHEDGVGKPPPWSIVAKTTGLRLEMRHRDGTRVILNLGPLPVNAPARIAVRYRSSLASGLIVAYRDGVQMGQVTDSNRYTAHYPVRPRVGVYRGHTGGTQAAWFGPLLRGRSLAEVTPRDCSALEAAVAEASAKVADLRSIWQTLQQSYWDAESALEAAEEAHRAAQAALDACRQG